MTGVKQSRREAQKGLAHYASLSGRPTPAAVFEQIAPVRKRKPSAGKSEHTIQCEVILWWHYNHAKYRLPEFALYAVPSGGHRSPVTGAMLKAEGVRPGIPDLFLAVPRGSLHGMAIEMKRPGGAASDAQLEVLNYLESVGYATHICDSLDKAIEVVTTYLEGKP